jgi:hypothetical protein
MIFPPKADPAGQSTWRGAWAQPCFRQTFLAVCLVLATLAAVLPVFFRWIQHKPGLVPPDPLIHAVGPADLSIPVFTLLYAVIAATVVAVAPRPHLLLRGLFAYALLLLLRMSSMAVFTLEPPADAVPLTDPVTGPFYPGNAPFLKDLFFSGHTATLALMALLAPWRWLRTVAWSAAAAVGLMVIAQHVHWTMDVVAAPFAACAAWALAGLWLRRITPCRPPASA